MEDLVLLQGVLDFSGPHCRKLEELARGRRDKKSVVPFKHEHSRTQRRRDDFGIFKAPSLIRGVTSIVALA